MKNKTLKQMIKEIENKPREKYKKEFITGDEFEAWLKIKKKDSIINIKK